MLDAGPTITTIALGILSSYLANRADDGQAELARVMHERLAQRDPLPTNSQVENSCRRALRHSLQMMAQAMELHHAKPKTIVEAWGNRRDPEGKWKPLFEWWHTTEGAWFDALTVEIASEDALNVFDMRLRGDQPTSSLRAALLPENTGELETQFNVAVADWLERRVQTGTAPKLLDQWLTEGWPISESSPGIRIKIFDAWLLFFREELIVNAPAFRQLTVEWMGAIDARLSNLEIVPQEFRDWLLVHFDDHSRQLADLHHSLNTTMAMVHAVGDQAGRLVSLFVAFRNDLRLTHSSILQELGDLRTQVEVTREQSADREAEFLESTRRISAKLERLDEAIQIDAQKIVFHGNNSDDRPFVGDSALLEMDAASRFTKLLGRGQEKGVLTRTWRNSNRTAPKIISLVAMGGIGKTSLVIEWLRDLQESGWSDVGAFFDCSFYSQGTGDQSDANSSIFLDKCLRHFGRADIADSSSGPGVKARQLVNEIVKHRSLLVLDGVEPLQHPKDGRMDGRFRDEGLKTLLRLLASNPKFEGLCIVTTRVSLVDLHGSRRFREYELESLKVRDGAKLLHFAGANKDGNQTIVNDHQLLADTAKACHGHALTLQILGSYLRHVHGGDIRKRSYVDWSTAISQEQEGHTFRVMDAYQHWFAENGEEGKQQMAAIRLLGLFNRPAGADCLEALRTADPIPGLTELIHVDVLSLTRWNTLLSLLQNEHGLLKITWSGGDIMTVDAHPLIREYFSLQLRGNQGPGFKTVSPNSARGSTLSAAWVEGHRVLFRHLCETTPFRPDTLAGLQPLYQAVSHGCHAGLQQEACDDIYCDRILRGDDEDGGGYYAPTKLGAVEADLGAIVCFYEKPWAKLSSNLALSDQAWLLNKAAIRLQALGRLVDAVEPIEVALKLDVASDDWYRAAINCENLSGLKVAMGLISAAAEVGQAGVEYADKSGEPDMRCNSRATLGDALHQMGKRSDALQLFEQAEAIQSEDESGRDMLHGNIGFRYSDMLLSEAECMAWNVSLCNCPQREFSALHSHCSDVIERSKKTTEWADGLLEIALEHLAVTRAKWYQLLFQIRAESSMNSVLDGTAVPLSILNDIDRAVDKLVDSANMDEIPRGLLTRAWIRHFANDDDGSIADLEEVKELAGHGKMLLYEADMHLTRVRLFGRPSRSGVYPWQSSDHDLAEAQRLIKECGYRRRDEEINSVYTVLKLT